MLFRSWRKNNVSAYSIEKNPYTKNSFVCVGSPKNSDDPYGNYFFTLNAKGENSNLVKINNEYFSQLSFYFNDGEVFINTDDYLYSFRNNKKIDSTDRRVIFLKKDTWMNNQEYEENRNTSGMLFSNRAFKYKNYGNCILNLVQYDRANYNKGFVEIISLNDKKIIDRLQLPYDSEMSPSIEDIDKNGKLDLLINCRDGNLYCYDLGARQ